MLVSHRAATPIRGTGSTTAPWPGLRMIRGQGPAVVRSHVPQRSQTVGVTVYGQRAWGPRPSKRAQVTSHRRSLRPLSERESRRLGKMRVVVTEGERGLQGAHPVVVDALAVHQFEPQIAQARYARCLSLEW